MTGTDMLPENTETFFKSESCYRTLVENSSDIIFSLDIDGNFTYVSPAWKKLLGHEAGEVIGHNFREFINPEDLPGYETSIMKAFQTGSAQKADYRAACAAGGWRWHASHGAAHVDENGVMTFIGMAHDITERLRIEEIMTQTEKMIMINGIAAGMAHEINNPLGAILQHAQNIERRVSADIPANLKAADEVGVSLDLVRAYLRKRGIFDFIGHIRSAGMRASDIISNMFRFSRRSGSSAECVELSTLLDRVLELLGTDYDMKKKYEFHRITLQRDYAADLPRVEVIVSEMEQALLNILKNAVQAMAGTEMPRQPLITLRTGWSDGAALVEICDNGPGMAEVTRLRVFEPFYTTKDVGVGAGLGLPVAYAIITKGHHGSIDVKSQAGEGSCFSIRLPLRWGCHEQR